MPESAYSVIDKAIRENRHGEILLYVLSTLVVGVGIFAIIYGALNKDGLVALAGAIANTVIFPAFYLARDMRRQNIAIRLLEVPLRMAETAEQAAQIINESFVKIFIKADKES